jgi:TPR repeat protein
VASKYYQKAAAQDFSPAQHHLALLYLKDKASPSLSSASTTGEAAKSLLLSSALRDYPPSHFILATELQYEPFSHLEKAAALRYEPALLKLKAVREAAVGRLC